MLFRRLDATFGKLDHCTLPLAEGLNVVEAPNESGKSTLLAFLRAMLYGLPTRERGPLADKNRYAPWSLAPMCGTLSLTCRLGDITLQRDTARAASPMGRFSAVYTGSGEAVEGLTAADCGETLLGVPCEVYERSAFIRQSALTVNADAELERRIAALITTGDEDISFTEAAAALKKQLNARKYNKSGRIPALEAELAALERSRDELAALRAQGAQAEEELAALAAEEASLRAQLRAHDVCDAHERAAARTAAEAAAADAERRAETARAELAARSLPPRETLDRARLRLDSLGSLRSAADAAAARAREAEAALAAFDAAPPRRERSLLPLIIIDALLLLILLLLPALSDAAGRAAYFVPLAALLLLLLTRSFLRSRKARAAARAALEQTLRSARSDAAAQQKLYDSAARELLALLPVPDLAALPAYLDDALARCDAADDLARKAREARLRCELLPPPEDGPAPDGEAPARPALSRAELQDALAALTLRRREAQRTADYTAGRCRAIGDASELDAALAQKREALSQLQLEYDALTLAADALQSANTALQNRFSPALSRRAGELFSRLTGGKYESVLLDRSFGAQTAARGDAVSHDAQLLSLGALDQLYLAVRLAVCESVLPAADPIPLVLDDALVRFDDARCAAALDLLLEESKTRQLLLFTCQHREAAYLAGRRGVTLHTL